MVLDQLMDDVKKAIAQWVAKPCSDRRLEVLKIALTDLFDEMASRKRCWEREAVKEVASRVNTFYHELEKTAEESDEDDKPLRYFIVLHIRCVHSVVFFDGDMDKGHLQRCLWVFGYCKMGRVKQNAEVDFDNLMRVVPYCNWWWKNINRTAADAILREAKTVDVRDKDAVISIPSDPSEDRVVNLVQDALEKKARAEAAEFMARMAQSRYRKRRAREEVPSAKRLRKVPVVS